MHTLPIQQQLNFLARSRGDALMEGPPEGGPPAAGRRGGYPPPPLQLDSWDGR